MAETQVPPSGPEEDWGESLLKHFDNFADNPSPRCPCVLVLDTSKSMRGAPIDALNEGLRAFRDGLLNEPLARQRVEIGVVTFGGAARLYQDFVSVDDFPPPVLEAAGRTPLGAALVTALDALEERKARYRANGISYYRPWLFLITDGTPQGEPADLVRQAVRRLRGDEAARRVAVFAVGVEGANMAVLGKLSARKPLRLKGLDFVGLFEWLSDSVGRVAQSRVGDPVALQPVDWGTVG